MLICADTGLVLYEKEARTPMYPASITKVMTALIVLDHAHDLTERIEFCDTAIWSIPRHSDHIAMDVGETLSIYQALYALMLESANEVSVALALHIAGGVEEFADLMNRRAAGLGANDTHFVNPSGLHARGHVTTAYDMALIMREAVRNDVLRSIIATARFDIPPTERQPLYRHLLNTNRQIRPDPLFNPDVVGGKTGFTNQAGNTLVTYAYRDGRRLIATVMQAPSPYHDTTALLNFGFALPMESVTVFDAETYSIYVPVYQQINETPVEIGRVRLGADTDLSFYLPPEWSYSWLRYELSVPETLAPPVLLGTPLGRVAVYVQNVRVGEVTLVSRDAVFAYVPGANAGEYAGAADSANAPYYADAPPYLYGAHEGSRTFTGRLAFLNNEYVITLAIPLALSVATLVFALAAVLTRHRRRIRRMLKLRRSRFSKYPHYRYK